MKLKLGENMPVDLVSLLLKENFDVHTAYDENLAGKSDKIILEAAIHESRVLLTFDTDFCDIRKYPPERHCGIIVFRLKNTRWYVLKRRVKQFLGYLKSHDLHNALVIVDKNRIRTKIG